MQFDRNSPAFKDALDRHITGNYGEDQLVDCEPEWSSDCCGQPPMGGLEPPTEKTPIGFCSRCQEGVSFTLEED